jgi:hypothetical protein
LVFAIRASNCLFSCQHPPHNVMVNGIILLA